MSFRTAMPCQRCGGRGRCTISLDGAVAVCRTSEAWTDDDRVRHDSSGEEYVLLTGGAAPVDVPPAEPDVELASHDELDAVYTALRDLMREGRGLLDAHDLRAMERRGVDEATVTRWGYWSLVPGASDATLRLRTRHGGAIFRVPGIFERRMQKGVHVAGSAGLAIPVRDVAGRIVRVRVRYEEQTPDGTRKKALEWLSSPKSSEVTGVPATALTHVPLHDPVLRSGEVWVTEGEIKADIATLKLGKLCVSVPGVNMWPRVLPVLRELGARRVVLAFDADARDKPQVSGALQRLAGALAEEGYEVALATWPAPHKGIDDALVALGPDAVTVHEGADVASRIRELIASSRAMPDPVADAELLVRAAVAAAKDNPRPPFETPALLAAALLKRERPASWAEIKEIARRQSAPRVREWESAIRVAVGRQQAAERRAEEGPRRERKKIRVSDDENGIADRVLDVLAVHEPDLYARGGALVRVVEERSRGVTRQRIDAIPRDSLRELVSRHVRFVEERQGKDGEPYDVFVHPPLWCVAALHARGEWTGVRSLTGVVDTPVLRADGSVLDEPGYDDSTGYLYAPSRAFGRVPAHPSPDEGRAALARVEDVLSEFLFDPTGPYESPDDNRRMHLAAAIALTLTLVARPMIRGPVPAWLIDGPDSSAGKTNLAETLAALATGSSPRVQAWNPDEEEFAKGHFALLRSGPRAVLYDNVPTGGVFGHAKLDALLTAWPFWEGRVLGQSSVSEIPNDTVVIATGNNPRVPNDTIRRVVRVRLLNHPVELDERGVPIERAWKYRLPSQATELATEVVVAAATALRAFVVAGMPRGGVRSWASFDAWAAVVPACLAFYGFPDIRWTQEGLRDVEESTLALGQLLQGWAMLDHDGQGINPQSMVAMLAQAAHPPKVAEALEMVRGGIEGLNTRKKAHEHNAWSLGRLLGKYRGKVAAGLAFRQATHRGESMRWLALPPGTEAQATAATSDGPDAPRAEPSARGFTDGFDPDEEDSGGMLH